MGTVEPVFANIENPGVSQQNPTDHAKADPLPMESLTMEEGEACLRPSTGLSTASLAEPSQLGTFARSAALDGGERSLLRKLNEIVALQTSKPNSLAQAWAWTHPVHEAHVSLQSSGKVATAVREGSSDPLGQSNER